MWTRDWRIALFAGAALALGACCHSPRRSHAVREAFIAAHPCPVASAPHARCPGFQVDHVIPLCAGGADDPSNMQWLSLDEHIAKTRRDVAACKK